MRVRVSFHQNLLQTATLAVEQVRRLSWNGWSSKTLPFPSLLKIRLRSIDTISKMADEMGGWVVSSNLYKTYGSDGQELPQASINIRVPADLLSDAMKQVKATDRQPGDRCPL